MQGFALEGVGHEPPGCAARPVQDVVHRVVLAEVVAQVVEPREDDSVEAVPLAVLTQHLVDQLCVVGAGRSGTQPTAEGTQRADVVSGIRDLVVGSTDLPADGTVQLRGSGEEARDHVTELRHARQQAAHHRSRDASTSRAGLDVDAGDPAHRQVSAAPRLVEAERPPGAQKRVAVVDDRDHAARDDGARHLLPPLLATDAEGAERPRADAQNRLQVVVRHVSGAEVGHPTDSRVRVSGIRPVSECRTETRQSRCRWVSRRTDPNPHATTAATAAAVTTAPPDRPSRSV